jgi:hypothetical protein
MALGDAMAPLGCGRQICTGGAPRLLMLLWAEKPKFLEVRRRASRSYLGDTTSLAYPPR